ncbi:hypothetical protein Tco_0285200 [Tanacetum coccineum]
MKKSIKSSSLALKFCRYRGRFRVGGNSTLQFRLCPSLLAMWHVETCLLVLTLQKSSPSTTRCKDKKMKEIGKERKKADGNKRGYLGKERRKADGNKRGYL